MNSPRQRVLTDKRNRIKSQAKRMIWISFSREGIHCYPAAGTDPELVSVDFLQFPHRHMFGFKVAIQVFSNDRELEFIIFKRWLEDSFETGILQLDSKSCEMISDDLYEMIATKYPGRDIEITVSEDGENGATITYNTAKPYQQIDI